LRKFWNFEIGNRNFSPLLLKKSPIFSNCTNIAAEINKEEPRFFYGKNGIAIALWQKTY
jgi:hypothetical protein